MPPMSVYYISCVRGVIRWEREPNLNYGVWAKGQPPDLGSGHQVSSILTTPICGMQYGLHLLTVKTIRLLVHIFLLKERVFSCRVKAD